MLFYFSLFFIFSLLSLLDFTNIHRKTKFVLFICLTLLLISVSGLRWETGTDWIPYYTLFYYNNSITEYVNSGFEIGYSLMNYLVRVTTDSYSVMLFTLAIIVIGIKSTVIWIYSIYPLMTLLVNLGTFLGDIFIVRQHVAIALTLIATHFVVMKQGWKFLITICFASMFHISAIVFLLAYPIYQMHFKKRTLFAILAITILISRSNIMETLSYMGGFSEHLNLLSYLEQDVVNENMNQQTSQVLGIIRRLVFIPVLILFRERFSKMMPQYNGFLNLTIFGYIIYFLFANTVTVIANRLSVYFFLYEIFLIPMLIKIGNGLTLKLIIASVLIAYCGVKFIYGLNGYYDLYVPFYWLWENSTRIN